jgi:apolipoprotein N-acyltransferase
MLTGFPWNFLANSQLDIVPLAMFASITGVLGISLVVAWCSVSLLMATTGSTHLTGAARYKRVGIDAAPALGFLTLTLAISWLYTNFREQQITERGKLRIAMVQPSIPQQVIFDSYNVMDKALERWEKMKKLTFEANATRPDIIIWPEASAPVGLLQKLDGRRQYGAPIDELAQSLGTPMIVGTDEAVEEMVGNKKSIRRHNSCLLLDRHGKVRGIYRKRHLVMFGEYVPLEKWFPFLRNFVPVEMSFVPGDGPKIFDLGKAKAAPIICFEDVVYPMARKAAMNEVDFLVNLTNDGWFGESNQQWQHARTAAFRAIETGRPLVRCTNNGLTCWVDRFGRIHMLGEADIYTSGIRVAEIPLVDHANGRATIYQRTGDWLGWGCVIAFGLMFVCRFWPKNDSAGEPDMA